MNKMYILDTNILLSDKLAPLNFHEHAVIIPIAVLGELDNQKMRKDDLSRDARAAIRTLEEIIGETDANAQDGIMMNATGIHRCHEEAKLIISTMPEASEDIPNDCPDNIIINTAIAYQNNYPETDVILVSNDINLRLTAKGGGMKLAQAYKRDILIDDIDLLPTGHVESPVEWLANIPTEMTESKSCGQVIIPMACWFNDKLPELNSWVYNVSDDYVAEVTKVELVDDHHHVHLKVKRLSELRSRRICGISAKNDLQALALDALMDKNKDVVVLSGSAGCGKTLLALAAATQMVKGKRNYRVNEILFTKTTDSQFDEVGFLPGDEHAKLSPNAGALYDNMEVIANLSKNEEFHPRNSIESDEGKPFIHLKSMNFMRGRSLNHKILIIDEAQNLSAKQMRTLLSRAGEDCRVILMGNLKQIDNPYISENSSGLTFICQKFAKYDRASIIHLETVERSKLAAFVEDEF